MQQQAKPGVRRTEIVYQLALFGVTHGARRLELDDDAAINEEIRPIDARHASFECCIWSGRSGIKPINGYIADLRGTARGSSRKEAR
jgi:hypothetical protein